MSSRVTEILGVSEGSELVGLRESDVSGLVGSEWVMRQRTWGMKAPLKRWRKVKRTTFQPNIPRWVQM